MPSKSKYSSAVNPKGFSVIYDPFIAVNYKGDSYQGSYTGIIVVDTTEGTSDLDLRSGAQELINTALYPTFLWESTTSVGTKIRTDHTTAANIAYIDIVTGER